MGVRITVLGCSGSVTGADSPASGYLLTAPDTPPLVIDFGGGVLGALQRYADPNDVQVLLSHLHADHGLDLPGLFVWRRYGPTPAPARGVMYGPANTWARLGAASSPEGGEIDDFSDIFDVRPWVDGEAVNIGSLNVLPRLVCHPTESYGMRFTDPSGASFVYSGDTGVCDALVELARGADVLLCEASFHDGRDSVPDMHLNGREAAEHATRAGVGRLLLTHLPPWNDPARCLAEAAPAFVGPLEVARAGAVIDI